MLNRTATCRCGQFTATCSGEPVRISVCHCLECQKRSGSAFAVQARWPHEQVELSGAFHDWTRVGESGKPATFRFCPTCGATLAFISASMPELIAIPVGAFADPTFPRPRFSVYESRRHPWTCVAGEDVERWD